MSGVMYKEICGNMYSVVGWDEYCRNPELYTQYSAVRMDDGFIYPIRTCMRDNRPGAVNKPGAYVGQAMTFFEKPVTEEQKKEYSSEGIIDFGAAENMRQFIQTKQRLASAERNILTSIDNVFIPEIGSDDTPEMIALKQAIMDKHIDIDKYEQRFGPNYNNDKRLLKKRNITFGKLRSICKALDMKATITFEDANPNVPNPIDKVITAELIGDDMSVEEDE